MIRLTNFTPYCRDCGEETNGVWKNGFFCCHACGSSDLIKFIEVSKEFLDDAGLL